MSNLLGINFRQSMLNIFTWIVLEHLLVFKLLSSLPCVSEYALLLLSLRLMSLNSYSETLSLLEKIKI